MLDSEMDIKEEISEAAREYADLSAEAANALGVHLDQIGGIIGRSQFPSKGIKDQQITAQKIKDKYDLYMLYVEEMKKRKKEIEDRMKADQDRLREWRLHCGTEGASLLDELEAYMNKVRDLNKTLETERDRVKRAKQKIRELQLLCEKKDRKWDALADDYVSRINAAKDNHVKHSCESSWLQCAAAEVKYRFISNEKRMQVAIDHHRRMRHTRAQSRLDCITKERARRVMQICILAMQEETVEGRLRRQVEEIRRGVEDKELVLQAQLAQALGDEERAKEMVAEQARRLEEARAAQKAAEKARKTALKEMRAAQADAAAAREERDAALQAKAEAEAAQEAAEKARDFAVGERNDAQHRAEVADEARLLAEDGLRRAEVQVKKKSRKVDSLQRMLAELGAESDSDAPPDERAPPFFSNEDGSKEPRPRTRKERMAMAYREAESARCELRLGMAAMVDKDAATAVRLEQLQEKLRTVDREVLILRKANEELARDANATGGTFLKMKSSFGGAEDDTGVHAPLPEPPSVAFASSTAGAPPFSPARPSFMTASGGLVNGSPRLLTRTASSPISMPALGSSEHPTPPDRVTLAPLRKLKRDPSLWRMGWHP